MEDMENKSGSARSLNGSNVNTYNKRDIYEQEIRPLLDKVKNICIINQLPFASMCAVESEDDATAFENVFIGTGFLNLNLADDRFVNFLMLLRGAKTVFPSQIRENDIISIDMASSAPDEVNEQIPETNIAAVNGNVTFLQFDGEFDPQKYFKRAPDGPK